MELEFKDVIEAAVALGALLGGIGIGVGRAVRREAKAQVAPLALGGGVFQLGQTLLTQQSLDAMLKALRELTKAINHATTLFESEREDERMDEKIEDKLRRLRGKEGG